jgi:two-component system chemotaxis response regulator CheY
VRKRAAAQRRKPAVDLGAKLMSLNLQMPVLVVDDFNSMSRILCNILKNIGFVDVDAASDGNAALAKLRQRKYGLVVSDWNMEPMTGLQLIEKIRAEPALANTPFIMVTAESKVDNVIAAKKAGVNNYIVKPFSAQALKAKVEELFPG